MNAHSRHGTYTDLLITLVLLPLLTLIPSHGTTSHEVGGSNLFLSTLVYRSGLREFKQPLPYHRGRRELFEQVVIAPFLEKCFPGASADEALHQLEGTIGKPEDWDLDLIRRETAPWLHWIPAVLILFCLCDRSRFRSGWKHRPNACVAFPVLWVLPRWYRRST